MATGYTPLNDDYLSDSSDFEDLPETLPSMSSAPTTMNNDYTSTEDLPTPTHRQPIGSGTRSFADLADDLIQCLDSVEDAVRTTLIHPYWSEFLTSPEYTLYTKTPRGTKVTKSIESKVRKKLNKEKASHQEFRFDHLQNSEERKKYGLKFLAVLFAAGRLTEQKYDQLKLSAMEGVPTVSRPEDDPLYKTLKDYYLVPMAKRPKKKYEHSFVGTPHSGFAIFREFLARKREVELAKFLEQTQYARFLRDNDGNYQFFKYFKEDYYPFNGTPERVEVFIANRNEEEKQRLRIFLQSELVRPLYEYMNQVIKINFDWSNDGDSDSEDEDDSSVAFENVYVTQPSRESNNSSRLQSVDLGSNNNHAKQNAIFALMMSKKRAATRARFSRPRLSTKTNTKKERRNEVPPQEEIFWC